MTLSAHNIDTKPLYDICTTLAILAAKDRYAIDGTLLAHLIKRLIAAEVQPGGPYRNEAGEIDFATNLAVGYLFLCLKKPLPVVHTFVKNALKKSELSPEVSALYKQYTALYRQLGTAPTTKEAAAMYARAEITLRQLDPSVRSLALKFLARIKQADKHREISLLSSRFHGSLQNPVHSRYIAPLGEANILCWIAYTIYDHFIDGELVTPYLPVANITMRLSIQRYESLFALNHPFREIVQKTFTAMDSANAWELEHCRFKITESHLTVGQIPNYGRHHMLARRSFGHALGPLALVSLGSTTPQQLDTIEKSLRHYLIARQLNDDMHDWREDLQKGHISPVVALLLRQADIQPGVYPLPSLVENLTPIFWSDTVETMNKVIHTNVQSSKRYLRQSQLLKKDADFFNLIIRLDDMALSAAKAHQQYQSFLSSIATVLQ